VTPYVKTPHFETRVFKQTMQHLCNKPYDDLAGISKQKHCQHNFKYTGFQQDFKLKTEPNK